MNWFVYIIQTKSGSLYTGITTDIHRRFRQHKGIISGGAKFFRGNPPKKCLFIEKKRDRSTASKREAFIKKLSRKKKLDLVNQARQKEIQFAHLD